MWYLLANRKKNLGRGVREGLPKEGVLKQRS